DFHASAAKTSGSSRRRKIYQNLPMNWVRKRRAKMPFTIRGVNSTTEILSSHATASDTLNKVLELEQRGIEIAIKDGAGRLVSLDELSAICEADEDRALEAP